MIVAIMRVHFNFATGAERERGRILRSAVDRLRARKIYSVANVTDHADAYSGEIGIAYIGTSVPDADAALDTALQLLERVEAIIVDVEREITRF